MQKFSIKNIISCKIVGEVVEIKGWVRTLRKYKDVCFVSINDGSTVNNLQVVVDIKSNTTLISSINTGTSICVLGLLKKSEGKSQFVELVAEKIVILGHSDLNYPLQPKFHSMEFLRSIPHMRMRTNTFGAIMRIRSEVSRIIHAFFHKNDFFYFHSPLITTVDGEGAGEMFLVNTKSDIEEEFFKEKAYLTVTGQLEAEAAALSLSKVYTFAPNFRAENSNTTRHLAEFWMVEPEVAFADLNNIISLGVNMLKYVIDEACKTCSEDIEFLEKRQENKPKGDSLILKLKKIIDSDFAIITYTEAVYILTKQIESSKNFFHCPIKNWGDDILTEHEKFLTNQYFKKPVVITSFPKELKAFYMKKNTDGKTVAAADILVAEIGEIIGGSQREENYESLKTAMLEKHISIDKMDWYLDTRKFGSVVHSGFGLGFERLLMLITGMENIRDVIPFPRTPGHACNSYYKTS